MDLRLVANLLHLAAMLRRATTDDLERLTTLARREDVARTLATDAVEQLPKRSPTRRASCS